jgi:OOP family OmpA-OmpF porin
MKSTTTCRRTLGLLAMSALAGPLAYAQAPNWYVGANVGGTAATIDDARIASSLLGTGLTTTSISDRDRDTGYRLYGGYQFNRYWAVEGGYFDLGKFGYTANTVPTGSLVGDIRIKGLNLDLVGTLPLSERFSLLGRVGANYADTSDAFTGTGAVRVINPNPSKRDTNYKFGLGVQYAFNDALALRVEAERYRINDAVGNNGHVDVASIGLVYSFGGKPMAPAYHAAPSQPMREIVAVAPPAPEPAPLPPPAPAPRFEKYSLSATELFAFDSAQLRMPQPKLDEIASALKGDAGVRDVAIIGYTDRLGSNGYNQKLSEQRARAVKSYLVSNGVDTNRLGAQGRGEANPIVNCTNKKRADLIQCLEPNRRVEIEPIVLQRRVK